MLDGCTPTGGGIDEPTYGSWGPASGYPFEANKMDQAKASIATSDWAAATADTTVSSIHLVIRCRLVMLHGVVAIRPLHPHLLTSPWKRRARRRVTLTILCWNTM